MKKSSVISLLITLLLAAVACTHGKEPVKDSAGDSLKIGQQYFIQPVNTNGGGLVPAPSNPPLPCPLGINQALFPFLPGLPASFAFADSAPDNPIVNTSTDVTIEFKSDSWPFCNEYSKLWAVSGSSPASKEPPIILGGEPKSQNSRFKIEKAGEGANVYKLTSLDGTVGAIPGGFWFTAPKVVLTNDNAKFTLVKFKKYDGATTTDMTSTTRVEKSGLRMYPFY